MSYQCVATSRAGFIQQLAVGYVTNGYYFYVTGVIPSHKPADKTDCKILAAYDIAVSKWTRSRRKRAGQASVQYLRHGRFYVIIATDGVHPFFAAEAKCLRDIRRTPILFMGYSIGCRRERGGGALHASVRINRDTILELKRKLVGNATIPSQPAPCRNGRVSPCLITIIKPVSSIIYPSGRSLRGLCAGRRSGSNPCNVSCHYSPPLD